MKDHTDPQPEIVRIPARNGKILRDGTIFTWKISEATAKDEKLAMNVPRAIGSEGENDKNRQKQKRIQANNPGNDQKSSGKGRNPLAKPG